LTSFDSPIWRQGKAFWEATNHRWNVWVLQYSRGRQKELLNGLGWDADDWSDVARALAIALSGIAIGGLAWVWLTRERSPHSPWHKPMWRVHQALSKAGVPAPDHCPAPASALNWIKVLHGMDTAADERQSQLKAQLVTALQTLDAMHYGPQPQHPAPVRALVKSIEDGARQWRALRAKSRHRAH
jgi:hypothetical protein